MADRAQINSLRQGHFRFPRDLGERTSGEQHSVLFTAHDPSNGNIIGSVALPVTPEILKTTYAASYSEEALGEIAGTTGAALGGVVAGAASGQSVSTLIKKFQSTQNSQGDRLKERATASGIARGLNIIGAKSEAFSSAAAKNLGVAVNPYQSIIFKGTNFRIFDYSYTFAPNNRAEAQETREIIKFFKTSMLPSLGGSGDGNLGTNSAIFRYPMEFAISFHIYSSGSADGNYPAGENTKVFRIGRSVIETFSVDYNGAGGRVVPFHSDGEAVSTSISMTIKELQIPTLETVNMGF